MTGETGVHMNFVVTGGDFSSAGEASTKIKKALKRIGVDEGVIHRVAVASYEAEMNVVIHASRAKMDFSVDPDRIEVIVDDEGPGIADIELAMQEGYSTASEYAREMGFGAGMGLPNMRRCADELDIQTNVGQGTCVRIVVFMKKDEPGCE